MKASLAAGVCLLTLTGCMTTGVHVTRSLNNTAWGYQKVTSPVRAGEIAQRFELRAGDCGSDEHGVLVTETQNAAKSPQPFAGMSTTRFGHRVVFILNQI